MAGGMMETQELFDFAAQHNITTDIELIPIDYVNTAMERLAKADVRYRFVIDVGNTMKSEFWIFQITFSINEWLVRIYEY